MIPARIDRCGPIELRPATSADRELVWQWNFDPHTRAQSRSREHVSLAVHAAWYERRLDASRGPMWIIEESQRPIGVVRIDVQLDDSGRISIALDAGARGRGVGRRAIDAACRAWARPVLADIFIGNYPSRTCFKHCGFRAVGIDRDFITYRWEVP